MTDIIVTINALANEQGRIYCELCNRPETHELKLRRLAEVRRELAYLWDDRRQELAGHYGVVPVCRSGNGTGIITGHIAWDRHTRGGR